MTRTVICVGVMGLLLSTATAMERIETSLDKGWRFIRQDVTNAGQGGFDDVSWQHVDLPHTWNALDGQDGGRNYYRGPGWYRRHLKLESALSGHRLYLYFEGASQAAEVLVNGLPAGSHRGSFSAFCLDVTQLLKEGSDNVIAVRVSNAVALKVPPVSADFTFFGGLYRGVRLLATSELAITPLDDASSGVYLKQVSVTPERADVDITTKVLNAGKSDKTATVRCRVTDREGRVTGEFTALQKVSAGATVDVVQKAVIEKPHLWNGRQDPYCYQAVVEILEGDEVVDRVAQPLGLRFYAVHPDKGFSLNGRPYALHGVNRHQDRLDKGWAIGRAEHEEDYRLIEEMGCTSLRLAHYQHAQCFYDLCDRGGMVVIAEACWVDTMDHSPLFTDTVKQQVVELVKQNYNHPSICFWSLFNELSPKPSNRVAMLDLVQELNRMTTQLDPTRPTTAATFINPGDPLNFITETIGFNRYFGWYTGVPSDWGSELDKLHAKFPDKPLCISEYGAGASVSHHEVPPKQPRTWLLWHPEEWQCVVHEAAWKAMATRSWLWGEYVWNMFDFAADNRKEGDHLGRNDKGMVTYDRKTRKDVYFWYQANWTAAPMVHITSRRFNPRPAGSTDVKVYSNAEAVELFLGGKSLGVKTAPDHCFVWSGVNLVAGGNEVEARARRGGSEVTDKVRWTCPSATSLRWICSTENEPWKDIAATQVTEPVAATAPLTLDATISYQAMDGFGGCFNELGWEALTSLPTEKREAALKALFDPGGANFTLGRVPIGANDFSLGWYSLNETPGDYAMKDFSIERDRYELIPFIKAAMKYQPTLAVWGVPWSPPSWMTTNGRYRLGRMKQDARTLAAYALYFSRYVQAWRAEGINLYAVHPQNEPIYNNNIYPQCAWSGAELNVFLRDYLLPQLKRDKVAVEVWLGTIVSGNPADYVDPVLGDPVTGPAIAGVGYQYGGQEAFQATHKKYPGKKLAQTETECYGGANTWGEAMGTFRHIIEDTVNSAGSYFFWNMVLDESSLSRWNWRQNSLLTVDRRAESVRYNPEFYSMKHFSAAVLPGARRIAVSGGPFKSVVAFQNPGGRKVLVFANESDKPDSVAIEAGDSKVQLTVPAKSMNTVWF